MTTVTVNKSEVPIIEIAFAQWPGLDYYLTSINDDEVELTVDTDRPQILWYMGKFVGAKIEIDSFYSFIKKQEEDRKKSKTPTS